jgi:hypothetical protein
MTSPTAVNAVWLLSWLTSKETDTLPRLTAIGLLAPHVTDSYGVHQALVRLRKQRSILWRCGTRGEDRGHQAIRVVATGRVLTTEGCPFEGP